MQYLGVTSFRRYKEQYYISFRHMHALSKEIEHIYLHKSIYNRKLFHQNIITIKPPCMYSAYNDVIYFHIKYVERC